jgi:hypothetical protein
MRSKTFLKQFWLFLLLFLFISISGFAAEKENPLVGEETLYFSLPSTHDRLISYLNEYYGKYNLIITFFPAAFTPI